MVKATIFVLILFFAIVLPGTVCADNATVGKNKNVVRGESRGESAAFPDVCKSPSPGGPIPIPYPNIGQSSDTARGAKKVKVDGNPTTLKDSNFKTSTGDEPGSQVPPVIGTYKLKSKTSQANNLDIDEPDVTPYRYLPEKNK